MPTTENMGFTVPKRQASRDKLTQFFRQIQTAAYDGQNGSAAYALDRLALIQAMATTALAQLEE